MLKAVGATVGKEIKVKSKDGEKMCTFFDELERECEMRGRREGEIIGEKRGRTEGSFQKAVQVVKNVMGKLGMSLEEACELAEISTENYQKYANRVC